MSAIVGGDSVHQAWSASFGGSPRTDARFHTTAFDDGDAPAEQTPMSDVAIEVSVDGYAPNCHDGASPITSASVLRRGSNPGDLAVPFPPPTLPESPPAARPAMLTARSPRSPTPPAEDGIVQIFIVATDDDDDAAPAHTAAASEHQHRVTSAHHAGEQHQRTRATSHTINTDTSYNKMQDTMPAAGSGSTPSASARTAPDPEGVDELADSLASAHDVNVKAGLLRASAADSPDAFNLSIRAAVERDYDTGEISRVNDVDVFYEIGSGAYGTVYAAECPRYEGLLALKALPRRKTELSSDGPRRVIAFDGSVTPSNLSLAMPATPLGGVSAAVDLVHEADVMSRLRHENVVRIYEAIDDPAEDAVFLVMEFVDGKPAGAASCDAAAKQNDTGDTNGRFACTTLPEREQRLVARGVAAALQYCQRQKVVHGDVKPENVLLEFEPQAPPGLDGQRPPRAVARAKLADFGVAVTLQGGACRYDDIATPATVTGRDPWGDDESTSTQALSFLQFAASMSHDATDGVTPTSASVLTPPQNPASSSLAAQLMQGSPIRAHRQQSRAAAAGSSSVIGLGPLHGIPAVTSTDVSRSLLLPAPSDNVSSATAVSEDQAAAPAMNARAESLILPCDDHAHPLALATPPSRFGSPRAKKCARGTPAFLAPELVTGAAPHPTPASDAWALGVTLFGLRYGFLPFGGTSRMQLCDAIAHEDPRFPPMDAAPGSEEWRTERRWRSLLRGLLTKDPASRLSTTDVLRAALLREHDSEEK